MPKADSKSCLPAVILAGGQSQRLGFPKLMLAINQVPVIKTMGEKLLSAGWTDISVVVSEPQLEAFIRKFLPLADIIANHHPSPGPISSLRLGLAWAETNSACGVLAWPMDCPLVLEATLQSLRQTASPDQIVIPVYESRRGHPTWWGKASWSILKSPVADEGANVIIRQRLAQIQEQSVDDAAILVNINTPEQARNYGLGVYMG